MELAVYDNPSIKSTQSEIGANGRRPAAYSDGFRVKNPSGSGCVPVGINADGRHCRSRSLLGTTSSKSVPENASHWCARSVLFAAIRCEQARGPYS